MVNVGGVKARAVNWKQVDDTAFRTFRSGCPRMRYCSLQSTVGGALSETVSTVSLSGLLQYRAMSN